MPFVFAQFAFMLFYYTNYFKVQNIIYNTQYGF